MLATLTEEPFSDPRWIFERKLDGERCIAVAGSPDVHLFSRNRKRIDGSYPEIRETLVACRPRDQEFVVDGEIVAFAGGVSSFSALQPRMHSSRQKDIRGGPRVFYYVFDVIAVSGWGLERLPLRARKRVLRALLRFDDPLRLTQYRNRAGIEFFEEACTKGWEGLIAKRASSRYHHDRSREWLKFKCTRRREFVVGGFTDPKGGRTGFGALLVGLYDGGELRYAGKVGTGYDEDTLEALRQELDGLERDTPPFAGGEELPDADVHWVSPELVCEVQFTEWTRDRRLRHPTFLGLRRDKSPREVQKEG